MSRATPDQIIAHADLLHSVDGLLTQAEVVRRKREALDRLLAGSSDEPHPVEPQSSAKPAETPGGRGVGRD